MLIRFKKSPKDFLKLINVPDKKSKLTAIFNHHKNGQPISGRDINFNFSNL